MFVRKRVVYYNAGMVDSSVKDREFIRDQMLMRVKMMKVIHTAFVLGVAGFGSFVLYYSRFGFSFDISFRNPAVVLAAIICTATVAAPALVKMPRVVLPAEPAGVQPVLNRYQVFYLVRASTVEGGALLAGVLTLVTHNIVPAFFFVVNAVVLALILPSERDFIFYTRPVTGASAGCTENTGND